MAPHSGVDREPRRRQTTAASRRGPARQRCRDRSPFASQRPPPAGGQVGAIGSAAAAQSPRACASPYWRTWCASWRRRGRSRRPLGLQDRNPPLVHRECPQGSRLPLIPELGWHPNQRFSTLASMGQRRDRKASGPQGQIQYPPNPILRSWSSRHSIPHFSRIEITLRSAPSRPWRSIRSISLTMESIASDFSFWLR